MKKLDTGAKTIYLKYLVKENTFSFKIFYEFLILFIQSIII